MVEKISINRYYAAAMQQCICTEQIVNPQFRAALCRVPIEWQITIFSSRRRRVDEILIINRERIHKAGRVLFIIH